mmetsp:Transcript_19151/g.31736  ORF Transcript_19151/g.31736 Transcript_19151/m.31736 type:complete len:208 (-) Transcript_19151:513-1136(-)
MVPLLLRCLVLATFATASSAFSVTRREFVVAGTTAASIAAIISPSPASAGDDGGTQTPAVESYVKGVATLQAGLSTGEIGPGAALYVTARPNRPDNVPKAILDGSRGKPPPVLAARYADPKFPYEFSLTSENLTQEGASIMEGSSSVWWQGEDLVVSCRFDSDGVAATRDPTDLVGRGFYSSKSQEESVTVELEGRGLFGKSVTAKK